MLDKQSEMQLDSDEPVPAHIAITQGGEEGGADEEGKPGSNQLQLTEFTEQAPQSKHSQHLLMKESKHKAAGSD